MRAPGAEGAAIPPDADLPGLHAGSRVRLTRTDSAGGLQDQTLNSEPGASRNTVHLSGKAAAKYDARSWEFSVNLHTQQALMRYAHYLVMRAQVWRYTLNLPRSTHETRETKHEKRNTKHAE